MGKKYEIVVKFTVTDADVKETYEGMYEGDAQSDVDDAFARIVDGLMFDTEMLDVYLNGSFEIISVTDTGIEAATVADINDSE